MKVTMYKSEDGKLHAKKADCDKQNAVLSAGPSIKASIHATHTLEGDDDSLSVNEVCAWVVANAAQLVPILMPFLPAKPRNPRKTKAESVTPTADVATA